MTAVAISRLHFPVTTLGPGNRIGVWFQGCSIRCTGCISADTWPQGLGVTSVEDVLSVLRNWAPQADGLTVSGGEPFEQPEALRDLLEGWRNLTEANVLVFTGMEFDQAVSAVKPISSLADALMCGPYVRSASQTRALRGSDNQTLHILSRSGEAFSAYERPLSAADKRLDVMFDEAGAVWFAGIPHRGEFNDLRREMKAAGHQVILSNERAETPS